MFPGCVGVILFLSSKGFHVMIAWMGVVLSVEKEERLI